MFAKDFEKYFIGFDDLRKQFEETIPTIPGYPPYNLKKIDDNKYVIEMAVAGFAKTDIEIETANNVLRITGKTTEDAENNYLFKGVAARPFTREYKLADTIEVKNADIINGMLKIFLENMIPEHKKPKKIAFSEQENKTEKQFLAESE